MHLFGIRERLSERFSLIAHTWKGLHRVQKKGGEGLEAAFRKAVETLKLIHAVPGVDPKSAMGKVAHVLASVMGAPLLVIERRQCSEAELEPVGVGVYGRLWDSIQLPDLSRPSYQNESTVDHVGRTDRGRSALPNLLSQADWLSESEIRMLRSCGVSFSQTADGGELVLAAYSYQKENVNASVLSHWSQ